ncbi:GNAT family N-acetyltransferase [Deinococcus multiflagellatus]|uniref:GNAT family N-acetyltransferase n=1 Tax=Deinococcus multiflagellatus TaxID=1656887 RepID=A0ABW1ZP41_9DEIO|nr:GNAT family N-acetyltransferase [Deinococcus multiflagellatus]MBZ9714051.1 GNAT family N-acetyltransferase [Deinococcus multiflagellatus]
MPLFPDLLPHLSRAEAQAHRRFGRAATFGPLHAAYAGPGLPLNAAWHDGTRPPDAGALAAFEAFCAEVGTPPTVHLLSDAVPGALGVLGARGYALSTLLHVYAHDLTALPPRAEVEETHDAEAWATLSAQGFGAGSGPTMQVVAAAPGTRLFVARRGGEAAGSAALSVTGGVAALFGMSTRPDYRGQGVQTDLLAARLHAAAQAGADFASVFVTPGSPSERNIRRAGFGLVGARLTLSKTGPGGPDGTSA